MGAKKELLTLKQAVEFLNEVHQNDKTKTGKDVYGEGTLYNAVSSKKLRRHGPRHMLQLEKDQLLDVFGPKKVS
jgi:hypothetical protein